MLNDHDAGRVQLAACLTAEHVRDLPPLRAIRTLLHQQEFEEQIWLVNLEQAM